MKKYVLEFVHRGLIAGGLGPIVLAILYLILQKQAAVETLTVNQMCCGIFSLFALAFVAGGMNIIYQIERIPLMVSILIHGSVLYISYLITYLLNDWLEWGRVPLFTFTGIFIGGYLLIWTIIYVVTKKRTDRINQILREKQQY